ncbi:TetR/AcrR family transcriptional regulator [Methanosarcina acetivorans]|uniref:TetR/AcrR family transcriptional regulator n=1 Tax=Methanosarcina acetivorans TaxID=2214 RepID=UPI00068FC29A|nr:helix-turn-helix domain-containing protein [Methanosarcina acetivorans]
MTLAERKQRKKAQRCEDILNAAEKLFFSRGYDDVTMDEIANEVELNRQLCIFTSNIKSRFFLLS